MKSLFLPMLFFVLATFLCCETQVKRPVIRLDRDTIRFAAKQGEILEEKFTITNAGNDTLFIKNVETDCGCTTIKYPDKVVAPSKSTSILVQYNTKSDSGSVRRTIVLQTNATPSLHPILLLGSVDF